jgi:hypothetical protein
VKRTPPWGGACAVGTRPCRRHHHHHLEAGSGSRWSRKERRPRPPPGESRPCPASQISRACQGGRSRMHRRGRLGREREAAVHAPPPHLAPLRLLTVVEGRAEGEERGGRGGTGSEGAAGGSEDGGAGERRRQWR